MYEFHLQVANLYRITETQDVSVRNLWATSLSKWTRPHEDSPLDMPLFGVRVLRGARLLADNSAKSVNYFNIVSWSTIGANVRNSSGCEPTSHFGITRRSYTDSRCSTHDQR